MVLESAILNFIKKHISPRLILVEFFFCAIWHQYKVFRTKICLLSKMSGSMSFSTGLYKLTTELSDATAKPEMA